MSPLDLRLAPPRSGRACLDGLLFMPRTIDKIRATLPGGDLGPYHVTRGISMTLLTAIRVELDALRRAVADAEDDREVAVWLRAHADLAQFEAANALVRNWRRENEPAEMRALFDEAYPEYLRSRYPAVLDLLEADDREIYPDLRNE